MATREWMRPIPVAAPAAPPLTRRIFGRYGDWEDWLTFLLALGATLSVSASLEAGGWSQNMPPLTLVSVLALLGALIISRSGLPVVAAWPLAVLVGALVLGWLTLDAVGPGDLEQRLDAVYYRFRDWFRLAFGGGVSNDDLPFDTLVLGLTWLGVFLFGWSVFRWHISWLGLIPGGVGLFVDLAFVGDELSGSIALFMLFGFLLVMRTNLMVRMARWRAEGTSYPPLISLSFINFTGWALLVVMAGAWVAPVGPFATPGIVKAATEGIAEIGANFVRLAGPLEVKKVVPVHSYTGVLPFQGSVKLGTRELLLVTVNEETSVTGPIPLRGAVYDIYSPGGWQAGERVSVQLPPWTDEEVDKAVANGDLQGTVITLTVRVERKSVVGTVLFSPGDTLASSSHFQIEAASDGVAEVERREGRRANFLVPNAGAELSNQEVLTAAVDQYLNGDGVGLTVRRDPDGRVLGVTLLRSTTGVPDGLVTKPPQRIQEGNTYTVTGFISSPSAEELRLAGSDTPPGDYLQLPDDLPSRIKDRALEIMWLSPIANDDQNRLLAAGGRPTPYDTAKAIEDYLRQFPVDFNVKKAPPGEDAVDYFLFESQRGYFDYHASAMVVMLRSLGIPSRLAVGFVVDDADRTRTGGPYLVRDLNAYAWTEVYFPGYGWIAFNPSPDRQADLRPVVSAAPEPVEPLGPEDIRDVGLGGDANIDFGFEGLGGGGPSATTGGRDYNPLITLGVLSVIALLAGSVFLGWQRSVAGLPYSQQLWEKTVRLAGWAGHPPQPGQTPRIYAEHIERTFVDTRGVRELARAYNRSRFGRREVEGEDRERIRDSWPDTRNALLRGIVGRVLRRRRVTPE